MKKKKPSNDDEPLSALLSEWRVDTPLPPRFQERVWRGIARAESPAPVRPSPIKVLKNWIETVLPRPALAFSYVAILLATGSGIGWLQAQNKSTRVSDELSVRYVGSVDPYLVVR